MLNDRLCRLHLDRFVTAVLVILDPTTHQVSVANAGHMAPILRAADGQSPGTGIRRSGVAVGHHGRHGVRDNDRCNWRSGDSLTMYTDGLNEAVSETDEFYTIDRIRKQVQRMQGTPERAWAGRGGRRVRVHWAGVTERRHVPGDSGRLK